MNKQATKFVLAGAVSLLLFTTAPTAEAAIGAIGGTPAFPREGNKRTNSIFVETLKPGESVEQGIRVNNYTKETKTVVVGAVDSIAATDGSFSCKQDAEKKKLVGAWVEFDVTEVTIPAESNKVVEFTVTVPEGTPPGEHNGCITLKDKADTGDKSGSGVLLSFRTATRLAITVPGKIIKSLSIKEIKVARIKNGNYTVSPILHNKGNVSLDTTGRAQLVGVFGEQTPIKDAAFPVMAGTTTGWNFEFKRPFWGGFYKAQTSINYNTDPTAGIGEHVNDTKKIRKDTDYFFMIGAPEAIAVEVGVPLLIIVFIIWRLRRRKQKKAVRTAWEQYTVVNGDSIMSLADSRAISWKKIAKINKLKEPYILQPGQVVLVPPMPKNDDWIVDSAVAPVVPPAESAPIATPVEVAAPVQKAVERPVEAPREYVAPPKPAYAPPTEWVSPRESSRIELDEPAADWREGANDEELSKLEGIDGLTAVPKIKSPWDSDEAEKPKRAKRAKIKTKKTRAKKEK